MIGHCGFNDFASMDGEVTARTSSEAKRGGRLRPPRPDRPACTVSFAWGHGLWWLVRPRAAAGQHEAPKKKSKPISIITPRRYRGSRFGRGGAAGIPGARAPWGSTMALPGLAASSRVGGSVCGTVVGSG